MYVAATSVGGGFAAAFKAGGAHKAGMNAAKLSHDFGRP